MMARSAANWCELDTHDDFELFADFNMRIDQGETSLDLPLLTKLSAVGLSHPSKAFYAGDKEAYRQALRTYRMTCRHNILSRDYFIEALGPIDGLHWFERNEQHFNQLVEQLSDKMVVPFIGAGVSVSSGFPTWADHLRQQGRTAGVPVEKIETWLAQGKFEQAIAYIEELHGPEVLAQEICDVFSKTGNIQDITLHIAELFKDTLITTNYDRLLEQVFDTGTTSPVQVINGVNAMEQPAPDKTTIIKMHGDIKYPQRCILGKAQYDAAYGEAKLDLERPIPKMLRYYFTNNSLLFIGCSLKNDRTIQAFKAVKEAEKKETKDFSFPQHFAIEQAPESAGACSSRNSQLVQLGISPIWYQQGQHDQVEAILRQALHELNYKKAQIASL